ncbi:MAG: hypothetical protein OXC60_06695 [Litoreibacter sp.]|nr:hypothetical protein [Litoreibacter sp.]
MIRPNKCLSKRLIASIFVAFLWPFAALATCFTPGDVTQDKLQGYETGTLQAGLRTALNDENSLLTDGTFGAYSRSALARLCSTVPRSDLKPDLASTLDLARAYGQLAARDGLEDWRDALLSLDITGTPALPLRLAGTINMRAPLLGDTGGLFNCSVAEKVVEGAPRIAERVRDLSARLLETDAASLCESLPVTGGELEFLGAMVRFNQYEALLKGSLDDLTDPGFATWVAANPENRMLRLAGSQPAVVNLIEEYRAQKTQAPESPFVDPCARDEPDSTLVFFSLSTEELAALEETLDLTKTLDSRVRERRALL